MRKEIIIPILFLLLAGTAAADAGVIINLTFDNASNCAYDYGNVHYNFTIQGGAACVPSSVCKWYGCMNFSAAASDLINTTSRFTIGNGIATEFWLYPIVQVSGAGSQDYLDIQHDQNNGLYTIIGNEGGYGYAPSLSTSTGVISHNPGDTLKTPANRWTHYFMQWNNSRYTLWENGQVEVDSNDTFGTLNYTIGDALRIGYGQYGNLIGYMDEVVIYNRTNFTNADVLADYNAKSSGTPPDIDNYLKSLTYSLPWNDSSLNKTLIISGTMQINFTIANAGLNNSNSNVYNLSIDGLTICTGNTSNTFGNETNLTCAWNVSYGFHIGSLLIDQFNAVADSVKANNNHTIWIPMLERPYMLFNRTDFTNTILPYSTNASNKVANDDYNWAKAFTSDSFNLAWTGNDSGFCFTVWRGRIPGREGTGRRYLICRLLACVCSSSGCPARASAVPCAAIRSVRSCRRGVQVRVA